MSNPAPAKKPFPVILLHGHGQSGKAFRAKTGAVRGGLKKACSFHYVDGPFELLAPEARSWIRRDREPGEGTLEELEDELETSGCEGIEESLRLIAAKIAEIQSQQGPDQKVSLFGFSFGAAVVAAFLSKLGGGKVDGMSLEDIGFVACFSGFMLRHFGPDPTHVTEKKRAYMTTNLPSYHCFGMGDEVVAPTRSMELASFLPGHRSLLSTGGRRE